MTVREPREVSSYLRLTRPSSGAWWRLAVGLVTATVGFFAVTLLALGVVAGVLPIFGAHLVVAAHTIGPALLLATNLGLGLCIPLAGLLSWLVYRVTPRWLGSQAPGIRWSWLRTCVGLASVVWGVLLLLSLVAIVSTGEATLDGEAASIIVVVLLTTPLQAAGEEYLFRGFLLQSLGATGLRAPVCWVLSGLLFATAHAQFAPPLFADRLLIGVVFGWLASTTGGIESSIAVHAVKNVSVFIPAALLGQLSGTVEPSHVTWLPFAVDAVMLAVVGAWVRARYRRQAGSASPVPASP